MKIPRSLVPEKIKRQINTAAPPKAAEGAAGAPFPTVTGFAVGIDVNAAISDAIAHGPLPPPPGRWYQLIDCGVLDHGGFTGAKTTRAILRLY